MKQYDFIIIGGGLAGTTLALHLLNHQKKILLIDSKLSSSSRLAPGVWNPVVFKRFTISWNATKLIDYLNTFYTAAENLLEQKLITSLSIRHIITSQEEENLWNEKKALYPRFIGNIETTNITNIEYKTGQVLQAGRLDVYYYMHLCKELLKQQSSFKEEVFDFKQIKIHANYIEYKNIHSEHIIFCDGYLIKNNPYFQNIQLKPAKGEILVIQTKGEMLPENLILHKNISVIPIGENHYILGSTYDWDNLNDLPTQTAKDFLLSNFKELFRNVSYRVIYHLAGIRPAADRRPIIGTHPTHSNIHLFNGLGAKGVMLAPYYANQLTEYLLHQKAIDTEVDVKRFC